MNKIKVGCAILSNSSFGSSRSLTSQCLLSAVCNTEHRPCQIDAIVPAMQTHERLRQLCEQASIEHDADKMIELISEINCILHARHFGQKLQLSNGSVSSLTLRPGPEVSAQIGQQTA
jgi:hypothetical protein